VPTTARPGPKMPTRARQHGGRRTFPSRPVGRGEGNEVGPLRAQRGKRARRRPTRRRAAHAVAIRLGSRRRDRRVPGEKRPFFFFSFSGDRPRGARMAVRAWLGGHRVGRAGRVLDGESSLCPANDPGQAPESRALKGPGGARSGGSTPMVPPRRSSAAHRGMSCNRRRRMGVGAPAGRTSVTALGRRGPWSVWARREPPLPVRL